MLLREDLKIDELHYLLVRLAVLLVLFFCSGACGLTYQVLWLRLLSLIFGVTVYAASTVLAAFMAGLAVGSAVAGALVARVRRPLLLFGIAEILIGVSAMSTPWALEAASTLYERLYRLNSESLVVLTTVRLVTGFVVLLVPTLLMGMTLPVLSATNIIGSSKFGARVSALYAVNTAGAVAGAVLTGFYLIGAIGMQRSFLIAAAVNVSVGVAALVLERAGRAVVADLPSQTSLPPVAATHGLLSNDRLRPSSRSSVADRPDERVFHTVSAVIAISGLVALALEILWFRMLVQYLAATTYAFTAMLTAVLVGIALGGAIAAWLLRRDRDWLAWLAVIQMTGATAVLGSAVFLGWSYAAGWRTSGEWQASASAILPVTILMGLSFPIALRIAATPLTHGDAGHVARRVGRLYSLNVLGAIAGALVGGFVVLPLLGTRRALIVMAAVYGASALLVVLKHHRRTRLLGMAALASAIFGLLATVVPDPFEAAYARRYGRDMREFWREEGIQTAVSVHASEFRRSLYLDGLHQANDSPDMVLLHRIIGHLPMVLHPNPSDALVIGLGGGATAGAVSQHPATRVQVVELSDSVRRAAGFFAHVNYDVLNQPNVRMRVDDGRNFLLLSGERFDVITADIIQPIHAGAGSLYSREYFTLVRNALKDNGLALQWIGHRPPSQYRLIMRTFLAVFPNATLWLDGNLMVGSREPLRLDQHTVHRKRADRTTAAALDDIGLASLETLRGWYTSGPEEMRRFAGAGPVLTDDRPLLEFHRSLPVDNEVLNVAALRGDVERIIH